MRLLLNAIKWDFYLVYKYGIVAIAGGICLLYCISLWFADTTGMDKVVAALVFSDPAMYGFLFTAIIVLFEKDTRVHQVLAVTPLSSKHYLWSKAVVFSIIALVFGVLVLMAAQPAHLNLFMAVPAILLTSSLFVFVGVIGVSYVKTFNQFILTLPIVLSPVCLPFLSFFNMYHTPVFYLIPTQASLYLFKAVVSPVAHGQLIYGFVYLLLWNYIAFKWANHQFTKQLTHHA